MKLRLALSMLLSLPMLAQAAPAASPLLVIHGGAGVERKDLSPAEEKAARDALRAALLKGHAELVAGRPALAAVTAAITVLEDDPPSTPARAQCSPRRPQRAGCGGHGWREPGGGRWRACNGCATRSAGADCDAEIPPRDDGRAGRRSLRGRAGHSSGRSLLLPYREALAAARAPSRKRPVARHMPTWRLQSTSVPLVRSHWTRRGIWPPAPPPGHDQQALRPGR